MYFETWDVKFFVSAHHLMSVVHKPSCFCKTSKLFQISKYARQTGRTLLLKLGTVLRGLIYATFCAQAMNLVFRCHQIHPPSKSSTWCANLSSVSTRLSKRHVSVRTNEPPGGCQRQEGSCFTAYSGTQVHTTCLDELLNSHLSCIFINIQGDWSLIWKYYVTYINHHLK